MINILVPVDFSDTSKNALIYATKLFGDEPLDITILHVFGAQSTALLFKSIDGILREDAESEMMDFLKDIKENAPHVTFHTKLRKNHAVSTIADMGNSKNYDLIVMGTKGVSGLKEVFLGSVAGGVISKTSAPVLVVPLDYEFEGLKEVAFAVGETPVSDPEILKPLQKLKQVHDFHLELLNIAEEELSNKEEVTQPFEGFHPTFVYKKSTDELNRVMNVYLQHEDKDLLCLLRTKKGFIARTFKESVTLKQSFNSVVPLLVLHNNQS